MITKSTVDQIIETARVEEVVGDFVTLKKRGVNLLGLCPFHNEKTPSFTVSPAKGIYKCFGCGKAGNSVSFIMEHEHYSFPEALRYLAEKYNITIEEEFSKEENLQEKNEKESLFIVSAYAQEFYSSYLLSSEEGKSTGLSYLEERGFNEKTIRKFQLGYAPSEGKAFTELALKNEYKLEYLEKSGLTIVNEDRQYDRFRGRVIFPIHNLTGRVIAFGARILHKDPKAPKYINSPETDIYHKSKILYGISFAKKAIIEKDECYLTEGYTDVISLHQEGIENVVASSGTSLTVEQIKLIGRYTKNVTVLYDGDAAGIKASLRGIDLILEEGLNVKVVLFPDGEDPDSFAKNHSHSELTDFLKKNAQDFIKFKTSLLLSEVVNDPVRKAGLIKDIVETISKIPDVITRSIYASKCSELLEIDEQVLVFEINKIIRNKFYSKYKVEYEEIEPEIKQRIEKKYDLKESLKQQEEEILRILLNYSDNEIILTEQDPDDKHKVKIYKPQVKNFITYELNTDDLKIEEPLFSKMYNHFSYLSEEDKSFDINYFLNLEEEEIKNATINLTTSQYQLSDWNIVGIHVPLEKDRLGNLVEREVYRFKLKKIMVLLADSLKAIKEYSSDEEKYENLQDQHYAMLKIRKQLADYLGTVVLL
jgi:DNA primase